MVEYMLSVDKVLGSIPCISTKRKKKSKQAFVETCHERGERNGVFNFFHVEPFLKQTLIRNPQTELQGACLNEWLGHTHARMHVHMCAHTHSRLVTQWFENH